MKSNKRYASAALASLLGAAILSGVALAGNPHGTTPGKTKGQTTTSASASAAGNSLGVKPSSTTHFKVHAAAGSSATKRYGTGKTAGQIAMQNGAGASTILYGPGNSQPHKALLCASGNVHLVDVHALKAHGGASSCTSAAASTAASTSSSAASTSSSATIAANGKGIAAKTSGRNSSKGAFTPPRAGNGGVAGAVSGQAKAARPVTGTANFTG